MIFIHFATKRKLDVKFFDWLISRTNFIQAFTILKGADPGLKFGIDSMIPASDDVRKQALLALTAEFVQQGHPAAYAQYMAMASIFQADLDLRNAQLSGLLHWLQIHEADKYPAGLEVVETIRIEFENRVQQHS